ncbi:MAG TPA: thioredoxin family protein [Flavobacterium sp.]|jgi:thiol-disulfide isomerase/thioredoxin
MKDIILNSLLKSYTYTQYRKIIADLLLEKKSTGAIQSEDLTHYSSLNDIRMNRLDKTITITDENRQKLQALQKEYIWLVISEGWCGDAAQLLPIFNKMAQCSEKIQLSIVFRDENSELMNLFLTNGGRSIPKLIIIDKATMEVIANFGPRPSVAGAMIKNYKQLMGVIDEKVKTDLQLWYLKDKGLSTQNEVLALLKE